MSCDHAKIIELANAVERMALICEDQTRCQIERTKLGWIAAGEDGRFGIAVKTDSAALRWQALEAERCALIQMARDTVASFSKAQKDTP